MRLSIPVIRVKKGTTATPARIDATPATSKAGRAAPTAAMTGPEKVCPNPSPSMMSATGRTAGCTATGRNQASAAVAASAPIIQASGTCRRVNSAPPRIAAISVLT